MNADLIRVFNEHGRRLELLETPDYGGVLPNLNAHTMFGAAPWRSASYNAGAFQEMLDEANTKGAAICVIPTLSGGYYDIGSTGLTLYEGTRLVGGGFATTAGDATPSYDAPYLRYSGSGAALTIDGAWNGGSGSTLRRFIELSNFGIVCAHASASTGISADFMTLFLLDRINVYGARTDGLWMRNCFNGTIRGCRIKNMATNGDCIDLTIDAADAVFSGQLLVQDTDLWNGNKGINIQAPASIMAQVILEKCHSQQCAYGAYIGESGSPRAVSFINHHFEGNSTAGLYAHSNASESTILLENCFWNQDSGSWCVNFNGDGLLMLGGHLRASGTNPDGLLLNGTNMVVRGPISFRNVGKAIELGASANEVIIGGPLTFTSVTTPFTDSGAANVQFDNEVWLESPVFDLSAAATDQVIFYLPRNMWLHEVHVVYTEATSADAGVELRLGDVADADKYWALTSEVSKTKHDVTVSSTFNARLVSEDTKLVAECAGGKTGAGEAKLLVQLRPFTLE